MKKLAALSILVVLALVGASIAVGAVSGKKKAAAKTATTQRAPETPLTGDTLAKAEAAAVAKVGGSADSATTETGGTNSAAAYEVHVTKADGTHVTVIEDANFNVLSVDTGCPGGHGPHGGGPGGNGETPLTGDTLTQANAAAVAKVGGTADAATTETDGPNAAAAYEVHVTKADGTHVTVIEDNAFNVLAVQTGGPGHGPGRPHGGHRP